MATAELQRRFLTVPEVAAQLRVSAKTVYRLIDAGELPAFKIGWQLRVCEAELEQWLLGSGRGESDA